MIPFDSIGGLNRVDRMSKQWPLHAFRDIVVIEQMQKYSSLFSLMARDRSSSAPKFPYLSRSL